jgi:hypothetical protein
MKSREEKGKGKGKKGKKIPLPPSPVALPLFPFGTFLLPLFIPCPLPTEQKKK